MSVCYLLTDSWQVNRDFVSRVTTPSKQVALLFIAYMFRVRDNRANYLPDVLIMNLRIINNDIVVLKSENMCSYCYNVVFMIAHVTSKYYFTAERRSCNARALYIVDVTTLILKTVSFLEQDTLYISCNAYPLITVVVSWSSRGDAVPHCVCISVV